MTKTLRVLLVASLLGVSVEASTLNLAIQNNYRGIDNKAKINCIHHYEYKYIVISRQINRLKDSDDYEDAMQSIVLKKELNKIKNILKLLKEA